MPVPDETPIPFLDEAPRLPRILSAFTPTLYVHGEIDQALSRRFVEALDELRFGRQVTAALIDIASGGGDYFALATMLSAMA